MNNLAETMARPEITTSYEDFQQLPEWQRMRLAAENRIINTDTYNRTMDYLRGPEGWKEKETYVLQMRRSPHGYLVAAGIEDAITELTERPITQAELDFAEDFYTTRGIPFFNRDMWQSLIDEYEGYLPVEVHGATDGTVLLPGDPVLRVTGPGELIAHFEHLFHRVYYSTLVATKAHEIRALLGDPARFIEVGKRGTPDELTHMMAMKAMQIGGGFGLTSNDGAAAALDNMQPVGTIGHRYVQRFDSVEAAFRHGIENLDTISLLVDLVDSYAGLDLSLQLKQEYRATGKKIWVRVDSGDVAAQTRYYLDRCNELGFTDAVMDKIVVEGIESLDDIRAIEAMLTDQEKQRVVYGAGGLLVSQETSRSDASTGFKLSEYMGEDQQMVPSMKFSDSPGKQSLPGTPTVAKIDGQRTIAQDYEVDLYDTAAIDLLDTLYSFPGSPVRRASTPVTEAFMRCQIQYAELKGAIERNGRTPLSPQTVAKIGAVMCRYGLEQ